jgi:hypothetical protein
MDRVPLNESAAKVREHLEYLGKHDPDNPLLETDDGDLIRQVLYLLEGLGYAVVRSEDLSVAHNLQLALKTFLERGEA